MTLRVWRSLFLLLFVAANVARATPPNVMNLPLPRRRRWLRTWRQRMITTRRRFVSPSQQQQQQPTLSPMLSFRRPTAQSLSQQFASLPIQAEFNHNTVGMTHPYFQSDWCQDSIEATATVSSLTNDNNSPSSSSSSSDEWWPSLQLASPQHWRILKYRQTVGHGWDCYAKVRDAALQWEFATPHQGIICSRHPAAASASAEIYHSLPAQSVHQISHGRGRRLLTYSRAPLLRFLFTINPVQVIYDIVDQMEYPVVYTSTAYATSQHHVLQGEERVTVVFWERTGAVQVEVVSCSRPNGWKGRLVWPFLTNTQDQFFQQQLESLRRMATME